MADKHEQEQDKNKRIRPREQARGQKVAKLSKAISSRNLYAEDDIMFYLKSISYDKKCESIHTRKCYKKKRIHLKMSSYQQDLKILENCIAYEYV